MAPLLAVFALPVACFCLLPRSFSCTLKDGCHLPYLWSPVKKKKRGWYMVFGKVDTSWLITVVLQKPLHMITTDWRLLLTLCLIDYFTLCFCYPLSPDANWSFIQNVFCKQEKTLWPLIQTKSEFITGTLFPPIVHKTTDFSVSRDCRCSKICSASECNGTDTVNCIRLLFSRKFKTIFLCCR